MRNFIGSLLFTLMAWPTLAMYQPGWERPVQQALMTIVTARQAFETVSDVMLVLNQRDGERAPTSVTLKYKTANGELVTSIVPLTAQPTKDSCGSVTFQAALPAGSARDSAAERLTINIVDH